MNGIEFPLVHGEACEGQGGFYYAKVFTRGVASVKPDQVDLGRHFEGSALGTEVLSFLERLSARTLLSSRERIVGVSVLRLCEKRAHGTQRLERLGSLGFTRPAQEFLPIKLGSLKAPFGVGTAVSAVEGTGIVDNVVDFPATRAEHINFPATHLAEAEFSEPGRRAYIALRGLERLVSLEAQESFTN